MPHPSHPKPDSSLAGLPQKSSTWHVAIRKLGFKAPVEGGGEIYPHIVVVIDLTLELFLAMEPFEKRPIAAQVQEVLFKAMQQPADGKKIKPYRPMRVEFEQPDMLRELSPALWDIEVAASAGQAAAIIDEVVEGLNQALGGQPPEVPGLLSIPGITHKAIERFFEAAALYYRAAPWESLTDRDILRVKFGDTGEERIVQVMGEGGLEQGMTLYENWEDVLKIYQNKDDPLESIPDNGLHGVSFTTKDNLPPEDQAAVKRYRWKAANRQAYPLPLIFTPVAAFRPERHEIIFYEALMRALPVLVEEHFKPFIDQDEIEAFEAPVEVTTADGPMRLEFSYPAGELPDDWDFEDGDEDEDDWDDLIYLQLTPKQQNAADLINQAWEMEDVQQQRELAQQALKIAPEYPETYLVLAQTANTPQEALEWYQKGIAAGNILLSPEWLAERQAALRDIDKGWDVLNLRYGLANSLRDLGRFDEAIDQYQQLLQLDPDDDLEARFDIFGLLLRLKRDQQAEDILGDYGDMMDVYAEYGRALLLFRKDGNTPAARKALKAAVEESQLVVAFLTGDQPLPVDDGETSYVLEDIAANVARDQFPSWWSTPGAIDWLKKHAG